ncbi:unnamed protein product, partial [Cyprideis torosa]
GGTLTYKGEVRHFKGVKEPQEAGIVIIHQELMLVPHLSIAENIFLGREPRKHRLVDKAKMNRDAQALLDQLGVALNPKHLIKELSVAQQQMVEVAKALSFNAEVLIMDEPTSALTETEIDHLFAIIHKLRDAGCGIIYISHRLEELKHIVDRVTVFRDGKYVSTDAFKDIGLEDIVNKMVGRSLESKFPQRISSPTKEAILSVDKLCRAGVLHDISLDVRRGEILGFAGLMAAGRTETARAIFGADQIDSGEIRLFGRTITVNSPRDAIEQGIAYLSEDRKEGGLALSMSITHNTTMATMEKVTGGPFRF